MLNQTTQEDIPECRTRPDSGLNAITELDPGYITGFHFNKLLHYLPKNHLFFAFVAKVSYFTFTCCFFRASVLSLEGVGQLGG